MATYQTNGFYYLTKLVDGRFRVDTGFSVDETKVISFFSDDTFFVEDRVIVRATVYDMPERVVAFVSDGMITRLSDRNYSLQTTNPNYRNGTILRTHTKPFSVYAVVASEVEAVREAVMCMSSCSGL